MTLIDQSFLKVPERTNDICHREGAFNRWRKTLENYADAFHPGLREALKAIRRWKHEIDEDQMYAALTAGSLLPSPRRSKGYPAREPRVQAHLTRGC